MILLTFALAGSAAADEPSTISGQVTDNGRALGNDRSAVDAALSSFNRSTGLQIYVIYVDNFGGLTGPQWAAKTRSISPIGTTDILIAFATDNPSYGVSAPSNTAISAAEFAEVAQNDIRPEVDNQDWAGAVIAAATGYGDAAEESGLPWMPILIGLIAVLAGAATLIHRARRRYDDTHEIRDEHGVPVDRLELMRTQELRDRAELAVAAVDDPDRKQALAVRLGRLLRAHDDWPRETQRVVAIDLIHDSERADDRASTGAPVGGERQH